MQREVRLGCIFSFSNILLDLKEYRENIPLFSSEKKNDTN